MRKAKVRIYHINFLDKGAEVLVTPASASVSLFANGLMVKQAGRQIAYIPNIHSFWELGSIVRRPTELGQSQYEQQQLKAMAAQAATRTNQLPPDLGAWVGITYPVNK